MRTQPAQPGSPRPIADVDAPRSPARRSRAPRSSPKQASTKLPRSASKRRPAARARRRAAPSTRAPARDTTRSTRVAERRRQRRRGADVERVGRHDPAQRRERLGRADQRAGAQPGQAVGLRERPADDQVGNRAGRGVADQRLAGEVGVGLVHEDQRRRRGPRDRRDTVRAESTGRSGCSGLVRKMIRVRAVIASTTRANGKAKSGSERHVDDPRRRRRRRTPRTCRMPARRRSPRTASAAVAAAQRVTSDAARMPSSRPLVRTTWSRDDAEVRARPRRSRRRSRGR